MNFLITAIIAIVASVGIIQYMPDEYGGKDIFGAISFPTSLDTLTNPSATDSTATVSHSGQHSDANDAIEALEAKVGIDSSAVTTSHDYKLGGVTGSDLACSLTGAETLTNKTLSSPLVTTMVGTSSSMYGTTTIDTTNGALVLTYGSDAEGDTIYRNSAGNYVRLARGSDNQFLKMNGNVPNWEAATPVTPEVTSTTSTSFPVTTDGTQVLFVTVSGTITPGATDRTISLKYGSTTVAQVVARHGDTSDKSAYSLQFASTTRNDTDTMTISTTGGSLSNTRFWGLVF